MKNTILILFLGMSLSCLAQDSQLFQNTWYLHNLNINTQNNVPPINSEVMSISLTLNTNNLNTNNYNYFSSWVCESLGGEVDYDDVNQNFMFTSLAQTLGGGCYQTSNANYESLYFNYYFNNVNNPFEYSILSNSDGSKTLTVTNFSGDKAVYGSVVLSLQEYSINGFSVSPNPVLDELFISEIAGLSNFSIAVFNINGKQVLSLNRSDLSANSLNVEKLSKGLYFILFEDKLGRIAMKKFIKK